MKLLGRLFWFVLLVAGLVGGYQWLYGSRPAQRPQETARTAAMQFCEAVVAANPGLMGQNCRGQAEGELEAIRTEIDRRAQQGARVTGAWVEGNVSAGSDRGQLLVMIQDTRGSAIPLLDLYLERSDAGKWWIDRISWR